MTSDLQTFESYRPLLFSIAYRMLGSAMEAEDMVQEAYLRYENVQDKDIQSPKAYLSTVITRLCLDQLKSAKTQRENYFGTWLPEPLLTGPSPSAILGEKETVSMAFMVLLENLSPVERAVFLLRDVFDYSYAEIAPIVGKSEANCRRYYHLAKQYISERRPRFEPSSDEQHRLITSFMEVLVTGDIEGLTHILAEDVAVYGDGGGKVPAAPRPVMGREAVARFLLGLTRFYTTDIRVEVREINSTLSLVFWQGDNLIFIMNFTILDNQIKAIRSVLNPDKLAHFRREED